MNRITASLLIAASSIFAVSVNASSLGAPAAEPTVSTLANTTTTSTTTTSSVPISPAARCPMWWTLAAETGFTSEQLPTLDRILFRESRCDTTQHNPTDPNGGSVGLTQINRFWCLPSRYYPDGYLQTMQILATCDQLYEPLINLRAALALVEYSRSVGLSDWHQWAWLNENGSEND